MNERQKETVRVLRERGDISIFDFPEPVEDIPDAVRFGDVIVEPNGDAYTA